MPIRDSERRQFWCIPESRRVEDGREVIDIDAHRLSMRPAPPSSAQWGRESGRRLEEQAQLAGESERLQNALGRMERGWIVGEYISDLPDEGNTKASTAWRIHTEIVRLNWVRRQEARRRYGPSRRACPECGRPRCLIGGVPLTRFLGNDVEDYDGHAISNVRRTEYVVATTQGDS